MSSKESTESTESTEQKDKEQIVLKEDKVLPITFSHHKIGDVDNSEVYYLHRPGSLTGKAYSDAVTQKGKELKK